jgi:hypothetical protein
MQQPPSPVHQAAVPLEPTAGQKEIPSAASSATSLTPSPPRALQPEDLYDFDKCTIVAVVQLRPKREVGHPRQVLLSVQNGTANKEDLPLYRLLTENELGGPFPPALVALFEDLAHQLPERKQRHEQRLAKKTNVAGTVSRSTQKPAQASKERSSQKKAPPASSAASPQLPVPTTTPPHEGELVFNGFDWLGETQQK